MTHRKKNRGHRTSTTGSQSYSDGHLPYVQFTISERARCMTWRVNFMRSKDAQKQLARTSLRHLVTSHPFYLFTVLLFYNRLPYYMPRSVSGQDKPNLALWLATRAGKMELSCPLGIRALSRKEKLSEAKAGFPKFSVVSVSMNFENEKTECVNEKENKEN